MTNTLSATTWAELYRKALLESDRTKLLSRIQQAREAIQNRARELWYMGSPETRERRELDAAVRFLQLLGAVESSSETQCS